MKMIATESTELPIQQPVHNTWNKTDTVWMLGLFATAVGAGTLFLPISAGLNGVFVLLVMALFAFPMTYFPHRALSRFVLSGSSRDGNIHDVVVEHFGVLAGKGIMLLYLLAFFPIVLVYIISITNALDNFWTHQLHLHAVPRVWLSLGVLVTLSLVLMRGKDTIVRAMGLLVFPLLAFLMGLSVYLIPNWHVHQLATGLANTKFNDPSLWKSLWLAVPMMVFSFSHAPVISSFASTQKSIYGEQAEQRCARIMRYSYVLICFTVLFFVFSCVMSLSHEDMLQAKEQNITVLTTLANKFSNPLIAYLGPIMAILAMSKSYLGTSLGVSEGATSLVDGIARALGKPLQSQTTQLISSTALFLMLWGVTVWNPSALHIIETISGPLIAVILFILPVYAVRRVNSMQRYRSPLNLFILALGLVALSALIYDIL